MPRRQPHVPFFRRLRHLGRLSAAAWFAAVLLGFQALTAWAQFSSGPVELSDSINLDEADSAVRAHLERAGAYLADGQWDEAVETLRQVMESHPGKMVALAPARYVNLADYCHVQLASLPPEALALYRQRVDALAEQWFSDGIARRSGPRLAELVDRMFCSSLGDDALWALGEMELEKGNHGAARRYWERLIEVPPTRIAADSFQRARQQPNLPAEDAALLDRWYVVDSSEAGQFFQLRSDAPLADEASTALVRLWKQRRLPATRLAYPGTSLPIADIRARLVLVSIMEGSLERARGELAAYRHLHPGAEGRLAGRNVNYVAALDALLTAAETWPDVKLAEDWPTFAGLPTRDKVARRNLDPGKLAWEPVTLGDPLSADVSNSRVYSLRRIGEDADALLSHHVLVVGDLVLANDQGRIFAFDIRSGAPAWPREEPNRPPGEIYSDDAAALGGRVSNRLGVPRFTMTAHNGKLYARLGPQVTGRSLESLENRNAGYLVCLDLATQGRMVWKLVLDKEEDERWAFEGSPLVDGTDLFVAMRKSDVRPQAHVACFDVETKRMRWRTMVCAAETAGGGQNEEISHNLLTLAQGTIYYNTNLGAVGAISTRDGRLQWATLYPRAKKASPDGQDKRTAHFYRDLNPCVYHGGALFVAPADCESVFALNAGSGEVLWESHLPEDAVHLLGVGHGNLIASGDTVWWLDAQRGKVVKHWPDTSPVGYGRGILMGDQIIWPTASALYILDQDVSAQPTKLRDPIPLAERGAEGGNLVAARDRLLIASPNKVFALEQQGDEPAARGSRASTASRAPTTQPQAP